jgi:hypothetical protein
MDDERDGNNYPNEWRNYWLSAAEKEPAEARRKSEYDKWRQPERYTIAPPKEIAQECRTSEQSRNKGCA